MVAPSSKFDCPPQTALERSLTASSIQRFLRHACRGTAVVLALWMAPSASASIFGGETLDRIADVLAWVVLIVAPAIGIAVFWIVHILPERIAEKRKHPQAKAI